MQQAVSEDVLQAVPAEPIQPGCNPNSIFASSQCHGAWAQYQDQVQARTDTIQHNQLVQARLAGEQAAKDTANQVLQQHDAEIANLRAQVAALTNKQPTIFAEGSAIGVGSVVALVLLVVLVRRVKSRFQIVQRQKGSVASA